MNRTVCVQILCSCLVVLVLACSARAAIVVDGYYRMGEADPGAIAGATVQNPTQDSTAFNRDLARVDISSNGVASVYSSNVASTAHGAVGSNLSMQFDGDTRYIINQSLNSNSDNWSIEAWFMTTNAGSPVSQVIASNGNTGANQSNTLFISGANGTISGLSDNILNLSSGVVAQNNVWYYAAYMRVGGEYRIYVNTVGAPAASQINPTAHAPTITFTIGDFNGSFLRPFFGRIDEVRVFHFNAGQFSTIDLLIPEPSSAYALAAASMLFLSRRKR